MKFFPKNLLPQKISLPKNLVKITYNFNPILHNRIVLYFISLLVLLDMIYFLNKGDITSFVTFVLIGFLTSFFSKNMIVIFVIALSITHILKYGASSYVSEGFDVNGDNVNIDDEITKNLEMDDENFTTGNVISSTSKPSSTSSNSTTKPSSKPSSTTSNSTTKPSSTTSNSTTKSSSTTSKSSNVDEPFEGKDKIEYSEIKKEYKEFQSVQDKIIKNLSDLEPALQKAEDFIKKFESYKEGLGQGNQGSP
jgi:hypothetical protein